MTRLLSTMKTDVMVQVRTNLYTIGIGAGVLVAIALSQLASPDLLVSLVPTLMLLVVGGSTLLYVSAMIIFEKDEGTLWAMIVSPVRPSEYLWSKIITLTALATLEAIIMIGGAMLIMRFSGGFSLPNIQLLLLALWPLAFCTHSSALCWWCVTAPSPTTCCRWPALPSFCSCPFCTFWAGWNIGASCSFPPARRRC